MIKYLLLDPAFCPMEKQGMVSVGKRFCIHRPAGARLLVNGHAIGGESENAWISASSLREENTVEITLDGISYVCQGFTYDGSSLTAVPPKAEEALVAIASLVMDLKKRLAALENAMARQRKSEPRPLFS